MRMSLGFDVGDAVERIEEKSAGSFIERERHGVDGEVAAAQIFVNGCRHDDGRLAGFLKALGARHADFSAGIAGKGEEDRADVFFDGGDFRAGLFEIFLQLERIALNGEIQVADGEAADDVADGAAGKVKIHARGAGYVLHEADAFELVRRQPDFHRVNVISHSFSSGVRPDRAIQMAESPPGRAGLTELSTRFPQPEPQVDRDPEPPGCKWLNTKYLCEWKLCGKLKKITQRLHFGYCQGGFRRVYGEKVRESRAASVTG